MAVVLAGLALHWSQPQAGTEARTAAAFEADDAHAARARSASSVRADVEAAAAAAAARPRAAYTHRHRKVADANAAARAAHASHMAGGAAQVVAQGVTYGARR